MENTGYSLADLRAATENNDNGFGGGNGAWWIIVLFLFMFGNNGWGRGNNNWGNNGSYGLSTDFAVLERKLDGINNGLCDGFFAMNNSIKDGDYALARDIQNVAAQQQQCCCETQRAIDQVRYDQAQDTCRVIEAVHADGEKTRALIQQNKIEALQGRVNQLETKGMIDEATCGIVRYPQNITYNAGPSPFFGGFGFNNSCGCGVSF